MIVAAAGGLRAKWTRRLEEWSRLGVQLSGELVAREVLSDLEELDHAGDESVTLREAAAIGGYNQEHLERLVRTGRIENVGRKGKPRIRRRDVPVKPGAGALTLHSGAADPQISDRRRVVTSVTSRRST